MALKQVVLHGYLGDEFGPVFNLDVDTPAEAVRALAVQLKGFAQSVRRGEFRVLRGSPKKKHRMLDEEECQARFGTSSELHIVPVPIGSKRNGLLKVILGVVLIGVGFIIGPSVALGFAGMTGQTLFTLGAGMFLNGLGQLLSPTPTVDSNEGADTKQSYLFGGCVNLVEEGNIIPLAYGQCWCGSLVLSAGMDVKEIGLGSTDETDKTATAWTGGELPAFSR